jgi:drug/metabolite transporter (DMT)-like permease
MTPALLGLVAAVAWGLHDFVGRFATRSVGQINVTLGVMLSGFLLLSIHQLATGDSPAFGAEGVLLAAIAGAGYALATLFLFAAYRVGSMSIVSPLVGAYPAIVVAFNVALGARPSLYAWSAMGIVMAGSGLVSAAGVGHEEKGFIATGRLGHVLLLSGLSAASFATAIMAGQTAASLSGEMSATWLARGFAVIIPAALLLRPALREPTPAIWWPPIAIMGLFDTTAMLAIFTAGDMPGREIAAVTGSSFGAIVALLAWAILKEPISPGQWAGMALIFTGTAVLTAGW